MLCSGVSAPAQLSHATLQFLRYVSLLEHIQQLREGHLSQDSLTEVVKLLSNLSNSPELQDPSLQMKLTPLLVDAMSGLSSDTVGEYSDRVVDFVTEAMEVYAVLPVRKLTQRWVGLVIEGVEMCRVHICKGSLSLSL